jgi:hypothetical protein
VLRPAAAAGGEEPKAGMRPPPPSPPAPGLELNILSRQPNLIFFSTPQRLSFTRPSLLFT